LISKGGKSLKQFNITLAFITQNRKSEILRALESCISDIDSKIEVVVVDNKSNDGTQEAIENYLRNNDINYTYHYSNRNLGVAGGRNLAFKLSKGRYVFSLDDDAVIVTKDIFNKITAFMDSHQEVAVLGMDIFEPVTNRTILEKTTTCEGKDYKLLLSFSGGGHVLRKSFYAQTSSLYPEKLHFGSEELYASLYAWANNMTIAYLPEFKINHLPTKHQKKGKERDFNVLVNIFIVRLLTFPSILIFVEYLAFILRLIKNGFFNLNDIKLIRNSLKERYIKKERMRISYKKLILLCKLFGIQKIL
jgi:glycosyltransferase involved in cell wall biosynthesis